MRIKRYQSTIKSQLNITKKHADIINTHPKLSINIRNYQTISGNESTRLRNYQNISINDQTTPNADQENIQKPSRNTKKLPINI